jgi:hypothetical protein
MTKYSFEYTDTFGGEANYSWVKRGEVTAKSFIAASRKVKKELGLTGLKANRSDFGDMVSLDFSPSGICTILFINWS